MSLHWVCHVVPRYRLEHESFEGLIDWKSKMTPSLTCGVSLFFLRMTYNSVAWIFYVEAQSSKRQEVIQLVKTVTDQI